MATWTRALVVFLLIWIPGAVTASSQVREQARQIPIFRIIKYEAGGSVVIAVVPRTTTRSQLRNLLWFVRRSFRKANYQELGMRKPPTSGGISFYRGEDSPEGLLAAYYQWGIAGDMSKDEGGFGTADPFRVEKLFDYTDNWSPDTESSSRGRTGSKKSSLPLLKGNIRTDEAPRREGNRMEIDAAKILWQPRSNEVKYLGESLKTLAPRIEGEGWEYQYARGNGTVGSKNQTLLLLYRYKTKPADWQEALQKVGLPIDVVPVDFGTSFVWPARGVMIQPITFQGRVLNRVILAKDFSEITIDGHEPGTY